MRDFRALPSHPRPLQGGEGGIQRYKTDRKLPFMLSTRFHQRFNGGRTLDRRVRKNRE